MKSTKGHVVIIDDDADMISLLQDFFASEGYEVTLFSRATHALDALTGKDGDPDGGSLNSENVDLFLSDIKMPEMTGLEFVTIVKKRLPDIPIILATAFGTIEQAIEAMKMGAYDYVVKPFKLAELSVTAARAIEYRRLQRENQVLRREVSRSWSLDGLIGKSSAMQSVFDLVKRVAPTTANVLITGESGTGKEMIAKAIHNLGPRAKKSFVAINCSAIPESLLESELFGHAKGAFTGAIANRNGLFTEAHGGTIFLDEIGDMEMPLQAKLLRVLQERRVKPVGENTYRDVDVRVIAATHKDLKAAIRAGNFREDLYYRLCVIPIILPPLRHRPEDIPLLADYFLRKHAATNGSNVQSFTRKAMSVLMKNRWEGNVRELENVIERAVVLATDPQIDTKDLPSQQTGSGEQFFARSAMDLVTLEELERRYIQFVLAKTGGRKEKASQILGINRRTLYRKQQEYGLVTEGGDSDEAQALEDESMSAN